MQSNMNVSLIRTLLAGIKSATYGYHCLKNNQYGEHGLIKLLTAKLSKDNANYLQNKIALISNKVEHEMLMILLDSCDYIDNTMQQNMNSLQQYVYHV